MTCDVKRGNRNDRRILDARYRIIADGKDITNLSFYVDARRRIVRMYVPGENGMPYYDAAIDGVPKTTIRPRRVRFVK